MSSSSFKPYKLDSSKHNKRSSPTSVSSAMRSSPPVFVSNTNIVSTKATSLPKSVSPVRITSTARPDENNKQAFVSSPGSHEKDTIEEYVKYQEKLNRDLNRHSVSPPIPHLPLPKVGMMPGSHYTHRHHPHGPNHDFLQCRTSSSAASSVRRSPHSLHNDIMSSSARLSTLLPPPCSCPMCRSGGGGSGDGKCHTPAHHPPLGIYPHQSPIHKGIPPPPSMRCRDPGCTNCTKPPKTLQNFVHPALVHQCTHSTSSSHKSGPYHHPPPSSYDPYFIKNGISPHRPKPYVCNWVFEGKHCGNNFVTSEELYQHLRTHTSLQQQRNNENESRASSHAALSPSNNHGPIPSPTQLSGCNIHGCPCSAGGGQRKSPPRAIIPGYPPFGGSSAPSGVRYNPYGRPVSTGGNNLPGHFAGSQGMYHY